MNNNILCMPLKNIKNIDTGCIIDVRCPREYSKGHMSNAINIPLFDDSQYQRLGELYKTSGRDSAFALGMKYANKRSNLILDTVTNIKKKNIIIYCARGGMRSAGFQKLLHNSEINSVRIENGYKSIRKQNLETFLKIRQVIVVAGSTGTGKTTILNKMKRMRYSVINLEGIARHRGSAFGDIGIKQQATQQQFENDLAYEWSQLPENSPVYMESESRNIGRMVIPEQLWNQMSEGHYIKIEMNISRRISNLIKEYGSYPIHEFLKRVNMISKKLGGQHTQEAIQCLEDGNLRKFCKLLLEKYYDKMYMSAFTSRESKKDILYITNEPNLIIIEKLIELT